MTKGATAGKRYTVSVPKELVGPLEAAAAGQDRSVSGQIVSILRQWVSRHRRDVVVSDEEFNALKREAAALAAGEADTLPTLERLAQRSYGG